MTTHSMSKAFAILFAKKNRLGVSVLFDVQGAKFIILNFEQIRIWGGAVSLTAACSCPALKWVTCHSLFSGCVENYNFDDYLSLTIKLHLPVSTQNLHAAKECKKVSLCTNSAHNDLWRLRNRIKIKNWRGIAIRPLRLSTRIALFMLIMIHRQSSIRTLMRGFILLVSGMNSMNAIENPSKNTETF